MEKNNLAIAETFYKAMADKNTNELEKFLSPDVQFISPVADAKGKNAYLEAAKKFIAFFKQLTMRAKFSSGDQVLVVYDVDFPAPIGIVRTASLVNFQEKLITRIELFFDTSSFKK